MTESVLKIDLQDRIAILTMNRPDKRNAMSDELLEAIDAFFRDPPSEVKAAVLTGTEGHFSAGLDLSEHISRTAEENLMHSRHWHAVMDRIEFGKIPVISALFGAVIGGGLELPAATHARVAEHDRVARRHGKSRRPVRRCIERRRCADNA